MMSSDIWATCTKIFLEFGQKKKKAIKGPKIASNGFPTLTMVHHRQKKKSRSKRLEIAKRKEGELFPLFQLINLSPKLFFRGCFQTFAPFPSYPGGAGTNNYPALVLHLYTSFPYLPLYKTEDKNSTNMSHKFIPAFCVISTHSLEKPSLPSPFNGSGSPLNFLYFFFLI